MVKSIIIKMSDNPAFFYNKYTKKCYTMKN